MSPPTISIAERFRGPPNSGNGGYVTGVIAGLLTGARFDLPQQQAAEVTLRAPVPLARTMRVERQGDTLKVLDADRLIAESALTTLTMEIPEPATWEQALLVREHSPALKVGLHPWLKSERLGFHPICFCCGAELAADQGLHVYAAPVPARKQVAAAWTCHPTFADADGNIPPEIVCTALDCPGQYAWLADGTRTGMLGRLCVRIERPIRAHQRHVVIGWTMGAEGRKFYSGTALFDDQYQVCAYAKAVWIGRAPG
jgi:hypothetical protein